MKLLLVEDDFDLSAALSRSLETRGFDVLRSADGHEALATVLLALGMPMIALTTISLPFELLLFVILDGWPPLIHGLVMSSQ